MQRGGKPLARFVLGEAVLHPEIAVGEIGAASLDYAIPQCVVLTHFVFVRGIAEFASCVSASFRSR